jgi:serine phosphatase RsbU (regulator of sigma subunit)
MNPSPQPDPEPWRRTIESLTGELLTVYEELALLYSIAGQFGRLTTEDQIIEAAVREAVDVLRADCGWVVLGQEGRLRVPASACVRIDPAVAEEISEEVLRPCGRRHSGHLLAHDLVCEYHVNPSAGPARMLAGPLTTGTASHGHLCLGRRRTGAIFTSADQKLATSVASLTAVTLENLRLQRAELERQRMESELELARRIQRALLPRDFSTADFLDASGVSLPCFEIGGDYFDLLSNDPDRSLAVIADVSGKGPAAALQAAMLQGIVHALSKQSLDLPSLLAKANECVCARAIDGKFVTAFLVTVDRSGLMRYANGGHNPALWITAGGSVSLLREGGPLLGFLRDARFRESSIQMSPQDLLVLYTDGVTDAEDANSEPFGEERLLEWASRQGGRPCAEVHESLLAAVTDFAGSRHQADDLTFLVLQYLGHGARTQLQTSTETPASAASR